MALLNCISSVSVPSPCKMSREIAQWQTPVLCSFRSLMYLQTRHLSFLHSPCACAGACSLSRLSYVGSLFWVPPTSFACKNSFSQFVFLLASSYSFCSQFWTLFVLLSCNSQLTYSCVAAGLRWTAMHFPFLLFPAFPCIVQKLLQLFHTL